MLTPADAESAEEGLSADEPAKSAKLEKGSAVITVSTSGAWLLPEGDLTLKENNRTEG